METATKPKYKTGKDIKPVNWDRSKIEKYAARVARTAELEIGQNPAEIVDKFGGKITYLSLSALLEEDGSIYVNGPHDFEIILPRYTSPWRDRFTISHELGHYFLHSNQGEIQLKADRKGKAGRVEAEANMFAAGLLMPEQAFRKEYNKTKDIARVAAKFGVSTDAAEIRAKVLNLSL